VRPCVAAQDQYSERNIRFGVREHAMGAICNGIALHNSGLIPYCATFFIFTDYMRNAMRMSALSEVRLALPTQATRVPSSLPACRSTPLPGRRPRVGVPATCMPRLRRSCVAAQAGVVYVMTHDSIGLGEDGPTHQVRPRPRDLCQSRWANTRPSGCLPPHATTHEATQHRAAHRPSRGKHLLEVLSSAHRRPLLALPSPSSRPSARRPPWLPLPRSLLSRSRPSAPCPACS
jgi:hypothetical protein